MFVNMQHILSATAQLIFLAQDSSVGNGPARDQLLRLHKSQALVQSELAIKGMDLCRFDELCMADEHTVQGPVEAFAPKPQKLEQGRKVRGEIVVLPDVGLEQARVVGQMIEDPRRGEPIACEVLDKIRGCASCRNFM
jgi:hypothetical protein